MSRIVTERRVLWLLVGGLVGALCTQYWPRTEAEAAYTAVSNDRFAMCSVETIAGSADAVFILDQTTGRLLGATPNRLDGSLASTYVRNLAADFKVADGANYQMVPAGVFPTQQGSVPQAQGGVWIAEQKSGLAILYIFPAAGGPSELIPTANFQWRKKLR